MKPLKIEPSWGLVLGFLIVPLAGALNWLGLQLLFYGAYPRLFPDFMQHGFAILLLSGPQGWMTTRLLEICGKGDLSKARGLSLGCALFALFFWFWMATNPANRWRLSEIVGFALPFLWSIGFLLFALFARPRRG